MAKKVGNAEVRLVKLTPEHRALFEKAKSEEVDSFLKKQAVRKCLDDAELRSEGLS